MKALFALALFASPSRAGVVMPVENVVAPAGPSAPMVPITPAAVGGMLGSPSLFDLRGALPLLPAPLPGLFGPALGFVGGALEAAPVHSEAAGTSASPAPAARALGHGKAFDKTPALPAKTSPGGLSIAVSRDRRAAGRVPENETSLSGAKASQAAAEPEISKLARPEQAVGAGREFFDMSREENRGSLESGAPGQSPTLVAATMLDAGAFGPSLGRGAVSLSAPAASAAFSWGHGAGAGASSGRGAALGEPSSEVLHDAVASAPGTLTSVAPVFFGAVSPNGVLAPANGGTMAGPTPSAPRPLALDLSGAGLIVRVRSALSAAIAPAPSAAVFPALAVPGPSTAWIERGAMLEAFSVSNAYAKGVAAKTRASMEPGAQIRPSRSPAAYAPLHPTESVPASLWWAWLFLPLFAALLRAFP